VHTEYSLLDGACRIGDLVRAATELGMSALAITDHGNLFGAIEFYTAACKAGIKPIIGCEMYVAPGDRRTRETRGLREGGYHLLLLAENLTGYRNLLKLSSIGYLEGFYYKPRIDRQVLREFRQGLIATSACLSGEIPQAISRHDAATARAAAEEYLQIFGPDHFFIELQNHGLPEQQMLNPELAELARKLGIGLVATNDVHYLTREDVAAHEVLCCISTRSRLKDEKRLRFEADQFYLKSALEMAEALGQFPEALENTRDIADRCNVELDFSRRYAPQFRPPLQKSPDDYLRELVEAGARQRYGTVFPELRERLEYELSVIRDKGFSSYFLIVWDVVRYAREHDILAVARGSGCSTVVGYCLGISAVDPLRYGLYFERFLDPERDELPDIDLDIAQDRRQEVIDYVRNKYGHVAQIITFGRLKPRAAIRDVCRALDVPLSTADRLAKLIPEELKMTIDKALRREPELRQVYEQDPTLRQVIDHARRLEGLARHASVHAAGLVIADVPLDELVPLHKPPDADEITTQFDGPSVEKVGLLKMDFLGLRTLAQIRRACQLIQQHHGVRVELEKLDLADQRVYELFARGQTRGVFQFESGGMREVLMKMRPNRIEDLIAANALYRPGPMEYIDEYIARKHGKPWSAPHPIVAEVLGETYGIMVYQEQVSRLVHRLGNVPLRRAFRLAKAISKKKESMINAEREPFLTGAVEKGLSRRAAEAIFADILKFGGYAFNKAHSAGYAFVAFQTAYLKTYYPLEFMAALLTYEIGDSTKIAEYLDECRQLRQPDGSVGIPVRPPDVNESDEEFSVVYPEPVSGTAPAMLRRGEIRFELAAISGVGHKAVQAILQARRDGGPFRDIFDFCERVDLSIVNKSVIEALIKAGAFDSTGIPRRVLFEAVEQAIEHGQSVQRDRRNGQLSMFGDLLRDAPRPQLSGQEWPETEKLGHEKTALGFYITRHPLTQYEALIRQFATVDIAGLQMLAQQAARTTARPRRGQRVRLAALISRIRPRLIRQGPSEGKKMLVLTLEDFAGQVEALVFPDTLEQLNFRLKPDTVVFVEGELDTRREQPALRARRILLADHVQTTLTRQVLLRLPPGEAALATLPKIYELVCAHRGRCELLFDVPLSGGGQAVIASRLGGVDPTDDFLSGLKQLLGPDGVQCSGPRWALRTGSVAPGHLAFASSQELRTNALPAGTCPAYGSESRNPDQWSGA